MCLKDPLASVWLTDPDLWQISVFLQLLSMDHTCLCMTIAFDIDWWAMHVCCIHLHISFPIKAVWEKGSGHSPLEGIATPSRQNNKIVSGTTCSHPWRLGEPRWMEFSHNLPYCVDSVLTVPGWLLYVKASHLAFLGVLLASLSYI